MGKERGERNMMERETERTRRQEEVGMKRKEEEGVLVRVDLASVLGARNGKRQIIVSNDCT